MLFYDVFFTLCIFEVTFYDVFLTCCISEVPFYAVLLTFCMSEVTLYDVFVRSLFKKYKFYRSGDAALPDPRLHAGSSTLPYGS